MVSESLSRGQSELSPRLLPASHMYSRTLLRTDYFWLFQKAVLFIPRTRLKNLHIKAHAAKNMEIITAIQRMFNKTKT